MSVYYYETINAGWPLLVLLGSVGFSLVLSAFPRWASKWPKDDRTQ